MAPQRSTPATPDPGPDAPPADPADDFADASAEGHDDDSGEPDSVPAAALQGPSDSAFGGGSSGGADLDPLAVAAHAAALDGPGTRSVHRPPLGSGYATKGQAGSQGYAYRAAVAEALGLTPQWLTSRTVEWEGAWFFALDRRSSPTADRRK